VLVLESDSLNNNKLYGLLNQNWKKKKKKKKKKNCWGDKLQFEGAKQKKN
jgi:hypothetical protein